MFVREDAAGDRLPTNPVRRSIAREVAVRHGMAGSASQRQAANGPKLKSVLKRHVVSKHHRIEHTDTDRWIQVDVLVTFAQLLVELLGRVVSQSLC